MDDSLKIAIQKNTNRFGALEFSIEEDSLLLKSNSQEIIDDIKRIEAINSNRKIIDNPDPKTLVFKARYRKEIKKKLLNIIISKVNYL